jgi:uncharacterized protein (DUF2164 family)
MKRYGDLWNKIINKDNIKNAHHMARKDKAFYSEVQYVDNNLEKCIDKIHDILKRKVYAINPTDYTKFTKWDKTKYRDIYKLDYFPHRIIQWCLLLQIRDIFIKSFVSQTYASIPNKGIHDALKTLRSYLKDKENTIYCLKLDIHHFYPSISREILKKQLENKFKDKDALWLMNIIIDSMEGDKGIAIGSLASQYFGNFALSEFDHWIKEIKHIKYYQRYCDDMIFLSKSKSDLHKLLDEIKIYLKNNLDLELKDNYQIFNVNDRGIDFLGYRSFRTYTILRKSIYKKFRKKMLKISKLYKQYHNLTYSQVCTANSYLGWLKWCNCDNLIIKYYNNLDLNKALMEYNKEKDQIKRNQKWDKLCKNYNEIIDFLNNENRNCS